MARTQPWAKTRLLYAPKRLHQECRIDKAEREADIDKYDFQRLSSKPNSLHLNLSPQPLQLHRSCMNAVHRSLLNRHVPLFGEASDLQHGRVSQSLPGSGFT